MTDGSWLRDPRYTAGLQELERLDAAEAALVVARARVLTRLAARTSRDGWQGQAPYDSLLLDVAGTSRLGQVAAGSRLADAEHLVTRLPTTSALLASGRLRSQQAAVLVEQTRDLTPAVCAAVEQALLEGRGVERTVLLAPADLRRHVKRAVLRLDADAVAARERTARRGRRTWVQPADDGMALLCALLPAEQAHAAHDHLTRLARQTRAQEHAAVRAAAGDRRRPVPSEPLPVPRTTDQLRADLLVGLLLGPASADPRSAPDARRPAGAAVRIVVHVPLAVALGLSDGPADLQGHGAISAAHARRLLPGATLQRACVEPLTGELWALDPATVDVPGSLATQDADGDGDGDGDEPRQEQRRLLRPHRSDQPDRPDQSDGPDRPDGPGTHHRPVTPAASPPDQHILAALQALATRPVPAPAPAEPQHDPSAALARLVRTRDGRCDGIGCTVPADRCELDHHDPWPSGRTSRSNLRTRSQRCHHAKHRGWTVTTHDGSPRAHGDDGSWTAGAAPVTVWTSPAGRRYLVPSRRALEPPGASGPSGPARGDADSSSASSDGERG